MYGPPGVSCLSETIRDRLMFEQGVECSGNATYPSVELVVGVRGANNHFPAGLAPHSGFCRFDLSKRDGVLLDQRKSGLSASAALAADRPGALSLFYSENP